jgi:ribosomal protein S18 acetylase RimI-like enzyme
MIDVSRGTLRALVPICCSQEIRDQKRIERDGKTRLKTSFNKYYGMIEIKPAETSKELQGVLALQRTNLSPNISKSEKIEQGFVTVNHTFEQLSEMNRMAPHLIALDGKRVVGYILAMTKVSRDLIPILVPMFTQFDTLAFAGKPLSSFNYLVVGQVCVDKDYRGQGIFDQMYSAYKKVFSARFDFAITEIAKSNIRSLQAHQRIGFQEIHEFSDDTDEWSIVTWNWKI